MKTISSRAAGRALAALIFALTATQSAFAQDVEAGEKVFKKCKACHAVGDGAKNKVGPALNNIVDQPAAAVADFKYSPAMADAAANGLIWDEANLTAFLTKPKDLVPKTKMSFPGLKKEEDIQNLLAYLRTFSSAE